MIKRYPQYFRMDRTGSERRQVNVVYPTPQPWQHNTPMADEPLLATDVYECWNEIRSAWDDDDDLPEQSEFSDGFRIMTESEFLLDCQQDRHYTEHGEKVYDV